MAPERRTARFETVALVRWPDGREVAATGAVEGIIAIESPGATAASATTRSSYPVEGDGRTFAELAPGEKHALSHRGRAFRALAAELAKLT